MLVLSRKIGEQIIIGEEIRVTVLAICGNQVRLGIAAPAEIPVLRTELRAPKDPSGREPSPVSDPPGEARGVPSPPEQS